MYIPNNYCVKKVHQKRVRIVPNKWRRDVQAVKWPAHGIVAKRCSLHARKSCSTSLSHMNLYMYIYYILYIYVIRASQKQHSSPPLLSLLWTSIKQIDLLLTCNSSRRLGTTGWIPLKRKLQNVDCSAKTWRLNMHSCNW